VNGTQVLGDRVVLAGGVFGTFELLVHSGMRLIDPILCYVCVLIRSPLTHHLNDLL